MSSEDQKKAPAAKKSEKWRYRTVNGLNGIQIRKVVQFLFACKAPYHWNEETKQFVYEVPADRISEENQQGHNAKLRFEKFFNAKLIPYNE